MPSFDFMAKYASRLLSSTVSDGEVSNHHSTLHAYYIVFLQGTGEAGNAVEEDGEATSQPPPVSTEAEGTTPSDQGTSEKEDGHGMEKSHQKPPYSYAQLIVQALLASRDRKQTLSNIYQFIAEQYPFYKLEDKGWKVC